ncbi:SURF1 family cytochrome oxidase biogenesis protein [Altererythrobacter lutimaris]|uniref:SURF1-like protein n=1 Tax=Altererythrobacter lutimaris TaxID=2743979 RepID=A0A850H9W6_9SPHN|nr:SURF1 family cytochrome oxidase biogenesis protein [Altererythrobacter lutimaris]NVE94519.1 SURF1 family protein [Altererythrobacter lutimaris]
MNLRQLPVIPTIVVVAAAAIMVALGVWQLGRADEKAALIAEYSAIDAEQPATRISASSTSTWQIDLRFQQVSLDCSRIDGIRSAAGTSDRGAKGWAIIAKCTLSNLDPVEVKLGWARDPNPPEWIGGEITGVVDQNGRIVADPSLAGLQPLAKPDPGDLPNNHLAYAGQWFFFALTALVIYWFAIQSRLKARQEEEG